MEEQEQAMTVYEYIRKRWPEHAQRIIACMREQDAAWATYELTQEARDWKSYQTLAYLFVWGATREGHEYWKALSEQGDRVDG